MSKKKNTSNETNPPKLVNKKGETPESLWETVQLLPGHILKTLKHVESPKGRVQGMKNMEEVGNKYRGKDGDTLGENIFEFIDPTGISSWDDVKRSIKENGVFSGETFIEAVAATPLGGKILKPIIKGTRGSGALIPVVGVRAKDTIEDIQQFAFGGIENPDTALYQNQIDWAKAALEADNGLTKTLDILGAIGMQVGSPIMSQGMSKGQGISKGADGFNWGAGLSQLMQGISTYAGMQQTPKTYATGGKAINVEGGEIVETPNGVPMEMVGPSHAQGGIDITIPSGTTEIFSKRVKGPDGKTMAARKKIREKQVAKLQKELEKDPTNKILQKTLEKTLVNNELQEQEDLMIMQNIRNKKQGKTTKFGDGGVYNPAYDPSLWDWEQIYMQANASNMLDMFTPDPRSKGSASLNYTETPTYSTSDYGIESYTPPTDGTYTQQPGKTGTNINWDNLLGSGLTFGDMVGMAGNIYSMTAPMKNTLKNRAGDTPNINAFKDYGKEGLQVLDKSKQYVNQIRDQQLKSLETSRASTINKGRNSARGINTLRAMDLATDMGANQQKNIIFQQFAQAMMGILGQEAQMENQQDAMVMQGEQQRDLADRQDRDNFYSQMAKNIANIGTGLQKTGKDINQVKTRNVTSKAMNNMFNYAQIDPMTGELYAKSNIVLSGSTVKQQIASYESQIDMTKEQKEAWDSLNELEKWNIVKNYKK